ncbi:MAG: hypothetical protein RL277_803, partial [Planctomycetota bacterium]
MTITKMLWSALAALGYGAALSLGLGGLASAGTEPGRVWTHSTLSGSNYATQASIGDRGGQVFTLIPGVGGKVRLISGATVSGGQAVWEAPLGYEVLSGRVDSADETNVHAVITRERASNSGQQSVVIRTFTGTATPVQTTVLHQGSAVGPQVGVHVVPDGTSIVAWWFDQGTALAQIRQLNPVSGQVIHQRSISMSYPPLTSCFNPSLGDLFLTGPGLDVGICLSTGEVLLNSIASGGTSSSNSLATANSRIFAGVRGFGDHMAVQVYRNFNLPGATYPYMTWFQEEYYGNLSVSSCAVSSDGKLLAIGIYSPNITGGFGVDILDLDQEAHPRIARVQPFPQAPAGKTLTSLGFADNRTLVGIATASGSAPELVVFSSQNAQWSLAYSAESPVDQYSVDIAANGRFVCAGVSIVPDAGLQAQVTLTDSRARNLELRSVPHANAAVDMRLYASPGSRAQVLLSTYLAPNPITFNNIGTLYVGSSGLIR